MRQGNTMGKMEYLSCNLYWSIGGLLLWQHFFPGMVRNWKVQWLFTAVCVLAGITLTWKNRRNLMSTAVNTLLPLELWGIYTGRTVLTIFGMGALAAGIVWLAVVVRLNAREQKTGGKIWRHGFLGARTIFVWVFVLCCVPLMLSEGKQTTAMEIPARSPQGDIRQERMKENRPMLLRLLPGNWVMLSDEKKLEVLQTVADIETARLGIPHGLSVRTDTLRENVSACYIDAYREIRVDENRLESADGFQAVQSICHEVYHAYQYRLRDAWQAADDQYRNLACFENAPAYEREFDNYISGAEDPEGYYNMTCEVTARQYALEAVNAYDKYLQGRS